MDRGAEGGRREDEGWEIGARREDEVRKGRRAEGVERREREWREVIWV